MKIEFLTGCVLIHKFYSGDELFDIGHSEHHADLYWDTDSKAVAIETRFITNGNTAMIELNSFVDILADLYERRKFTRLELKSNYEKTGKELMQLVLEKVKANDDDSSNLDYRKYSY